MRMFLLPGPLIHAVTLWISFFKKKILIHAAYPVKSFNTWSLPSETFFSFSTKSLDTWRLPCDKIFRKKSHGNCWMLRVSDGDVHLFHSIPALNFYGIVCFKVVSYKNTSVPQYMQLTLGNIFKEIPRVSSTY